MGAVEVRGIHHRAIQSFRVTIKKSKKVLCDRHSPGVGHAQDLARIPKWKLGRVISFSCLFKNCYSTELSTQSPSILLLTMKSRGKAIQNFFNDDSDDDGLHQQRVAIAIQHHTFLLEQYAQQSKHGGSVAGREYKNQKREKHHKSLMEDYFCERPLYSQVDFRRRFCMRRELFYHILNDVVAHEPYFTQKIDTCGRQSLSPEQKKTAIFRILAYGC
ncbi:hypothetical protein Prudu_311S000100 [Prunus dulcis]|uniref:Uncharacterized protein n=1 Tax=Prunus dulcis TaxID=3755 RepID=A0A5H2XP91_PRUDU|nr:hypothetical protein Prudu_311S000100 [Prunus dulcis]